MALITKEHLNLTIQTFKNLLSRKADKSDIVQSNWNQNDKNANDYVKNRTHWVDENQEFIYENKSLDFTQQFFFDIEENLGILFEIGETYVVNWNGENYECIARDEDNATCLGNDGLRDPTNGVPENGENVPFFFGCSRDYPVAQVFTPVDITTNPPIFAGMCEVTIYKKTEKVHQLDEKFIPDTIARTDFITEIEAGVGRNVEGEIFNINGADIVAEAGAEIFNIIEGQPNNKATGYASHAEGDGTIASGAFGSHAEGYGTTASGDASHAEGDRTIASGQGSHAEGQYTTASGYTSHAEGQNTTASSYSSHAEGESTNLAQSIFGSADLNTIDNNSIINSWKFTSFSLAKGAGSHVEGVNSLALGNYSHVEGNCTIASGDYSHAEGRMAAAYGKAAHAEGYYTTASSDYQHVQGKYNVVDDTNVYAHIVGNGAGAASTSNAHTLDWDGNAWFKGDVYVGSTSGKNKDDGSKKLATEEYIDSLELITVSDIDTICGSSIQSASEVTW